MTEPGKIVIVEGLIGAGKSKLCESIEAYTAVCGRKICLVIQEKICPQLLDLYLGDMKRNAFSFQVIVARDRCESMRTAVRAARAGLLVLLDRGLPGDMAFASMQHKLGIMSEQEYDVYCHLVADSHPQFVPKQFGLISNGDVVDRQAEGIDVHILYLQCTPQAAFARMRLRNNASEVGSYKLAYFEDLCAAYDEVIGKFEEHADSIQVHRVPYSEPVQLDESGLLPREFCESLMAKTK